MRKNKGFGYYLTPGKIREYRRMPVEMRLAWLFQASLLRKAYPKKVRDIQDKFREGKI
jgi:hypothetical protein